MDDFSPPNIHFFCCFADSLQLTFNWPWNVCHSKNHCQKDWKIILTGLDYRLLKFHAKSNASTLLKFVSHCKEQKPVPTQCYKILYNKWSWVDSTKSVGRLTQSAGYQWALAVGVSLLRTIRTCRVQEHSDTISYYIFPIWTDSVY